MGNFVVACVVVFGTVLANGIHLNRGIGDALGVTMRMLPGLMGNQQQGAKGQQGMTPTGQNPAQVTQFDEKQIREQMMQAKQLANENENLERDILNLNQYDVAPVEAEVDILREQRELRKKKPEHLKQFMANASPAAVMKSLINMGLTGTPSGALEAPIVFLQPPAEPLANRMLVKDISACDSEILEADHSSKHKAEMTKEVAELELESEEEVKGEIEKLEKEIESAETAHEEYKTTAEEVQRKVRGGDAELSQDLQEAQKKAKEKEDEVHKLKTKLEALEEKLKEVA